MRTLQRAVFGVVGLLAVFMAGCASEPSVVGTWETSVDGGQAGQQPLTIVYRADNTFTMTVSGMMDLTMEGTYQLEEGNKMTSTVTSASLTGELPEQAKPLQSLIEGQLKAMEGQEQTGTYEFVSEDELKFSYDGGGALTAMPEGAQGQSPTSMTLKRVK